MAQLQTSEQDGVTVLRLAGELTHEGVPQVERAFVMTVSAANRLVVDLSAVNMITTPGITMLIAADRQVRRRNGKCVICGLHGNVQQVLLERCRLDVVLTLAPDVPAAVTVAGG